MVIKNIMERLNEYQRISLLETNINIDQANQDHQFAEEFLENMQGRNLDKAIQQLKIWNKGKSGENCCKTLILIDATGSMGILLDKMRFNVQNMLERIKPVLQRHGIDGSQILMKIGVYRNYDCQVDQLYQQSSWETEAVNLKKFLGSIKPFGGLGNEAIEVGLKRATEEIDGGLTQVFIIGDMPHNEPNEITQKQNDGHGRDYWDKVLPDIQAAPVYVQQLQDKGIPVHSLYLNDATKNCFTQISSQTAGASKLL